MTPLPNCWHLSKWVLQLTQFSFLMGQCMFVMKGILNRLNMQRAALVVQTVKNPTAMQETWVQALHWEDPLEKRIATHSSILAQRIPWTMETGRLQPMALQRVRHDLQFNMQKQIRQGKIPLLFFSLLPLFSMPYYFHHHHSMLVSKIASLE